MHSSGETVTSAVGTAWFPPRARDSLNLSLVSLEHGQPLFSDAQSPVCSPWGCLCFFLLYMSNNTKEGKNFVQFAVLSPPLNPSRSGGGISRFQINKRIGARPAMFGNRQPTPRPGTGSLSRASQLRHELEVVGSCQSSGFSGFHAAEKRTRFCPSADLDHPIGDYCHR